MFDNLSFLSALSGIFGVLCIVIGSGTYVTTHFDSIPINAIEIFGWSITSALIIWSLPIGEVITPSILTQSPTPVKLLLNFLGIIFLPVMMTLSFMHYDSGNRYVTKAIPTVIFTTTTLVSGLSAFLLQSEVSGFYSVVSFFTALYSSFSLLFSDYVYPGSNPDILSWMLIAGLLLNVFIGAHICDNETQPWFIPFRKGLMIWGSMVYFTGGMVLSSRYWSRMEVETYFFSNFLTAGSLLALYLLLATVPNLRNTGLSSIVKFFICLYPLEKFTDISWFGPNNWPIKVALCGVALFGLSVYLRTINPNGNIALAKSQ